MKQVVSQLKVVPANTALRLRAILDFQEDDGTRRAATGGCVWLGVAFGVVCVLSAGHVDTGMVCFVMGGACGGVWHSVDHLERGL